MWDLVFLFAVFLLLAVIFEFVRANMKKLLEANPRMRAARIGLEAATAEHQELIDQLRQVQARHKSVEEMIDLAKSRIAKLNETIAEIEPDKPVVVREIGKALRSNTIFEAAVTNRYLRFKNRPAVVGKMNPIWERKVEVVIWAQNRVEAKRAIEREFPADLGFELELGRAFSEVPPS